MKKLHKKIGAMALACMVAAGGFAASGIKAHADVDVDVSEMQRLVEDLEKSNQSVYHEVNRLVREKNGKILKVYDDNRKNNRKMRSYILKNFSNRYKFNKAYLEALLVGDDCGYGYIKSLELSIKYPREGIVRIRYSGADFLIKFW